MSDFDREDFEGLVKRQSRERREGARPTLSRLAQAAVAAEHLTGDPHWDGFLQALQHRRNEAEARLEDLKAALLLVDGHDLAALKIRACIAKAEIDTLETVIALPQQMRETGEEAKAALRELDA